MPASIRNAAIFYFSGTIWFVTLFASFIALHDVTSVLFAGASLDAAVQPMATLSLAMLAATAVAGASWALIRRVATRPDADQGSTDTVVEERSDTALAPIR